MKTVIILSLIAAAALGASSVGKVTALKGAAKILQNTGERSAKLGSDLFVHDQIHTGDNTKMQVIFDDETIVTIGQKSQFAIDDYIAEGVDSTAKMSLFKGAMRTITGKIGKANPQKFQVSTKTATIGIRGTNFIVFVTPEGETMVACTYGAIIARVDGNSVDVQSGFMVRINPDGTMGTPTAFSATELRQMLDEAFASGGASQETAQAVEVITTSEENENKADEPINSNELLSIESPEPLITPTPDNAVESVIADTTTSSTPQIYTVAGYNIRDDATEINLILDSANKTISADSLFKLRDDSSEIRNYALNNPTTMNDWDDWSTTFTYFYYASALNANSYELDTSNSSSNFIRTVSDMDPNDDVMWGEWSIPISVLNTDNPDGYFHTNSGWFVAGTTTPTAIINQYAQLALTATYTGILQGTFNNSVSFSGSVASTVDFGSNSVMNTLSFNTNGSDYVITSANTMSGNGFSLANGTMTIDGAGSGTVYYDNGYFYGANGNTIGGVFKAMDNSNYSTMNGAYQAKTTQLP